VVPSSILATSMEVPPGNTKVGRTVQGSDTAASLAGKTTVEGTAEPLQESGRRMQRSTRLTCDRGGT
jgi:hypothetical protein